MDNVYSRPYVHTDILAQQIVRPRVLLWKQDFFCYFFLGIVMVLCSLLCVWSRVEVVQMGYQISQANQIRQELIQENNRLSVELSSLKSPLRIGEAAKNRLGFTSPKREQIQIIP